MKKKGFLLILITMVLSFSIYAQEASQLFFLPRLPQASLENPAIHNTTGKLAIGLPVLSGVYLNVNSNLAFDYLFFDGFDYDFHLLHDAMNKHGKIQAGSSISLFFASIRHNDYTFSVSVSERVAVNGNFDREVVRMIRDGIYHLYGTNQNLGAAFFQARQYKELGFGVARQMWKGFDIGIRPKLLLGRYFLDTHDFDVQVSTDSENRVISMVPEGSFFMSGPLAYDKRFTAHVFPGDYHFQLRNLGFAIDAGVVLKLDAQNELSVSIKDAGFIGFRHNGFDMTMARPWHYEEQLLYQSHTPDSQRYMEPREALRLIGDSIFYLLVIEDAESRAVDLLPVKLNITGRHQFSESTTLGISNQLTYYRRQPINMSSVFIHQTVGPWIEMSGSLSLYNLTQVAPGIGFNLTAGWFQLFLATNNILGFIQPTSSKHLNLCFGMNFLFDTQ